MRRRLVSLAVVGFVLVAAALPAAVMAAHDDATYTASGARAVFASFESSDGNKRTLTTVFATRGDLKEVDGDTFGDPAVLVWTTTWNNDNDKVVRLAFGVADRDQVKVNVPKNLDSGSVSGKVRVQDIVKDDNYTLKLDLDWTRDGSKDTLDFNRTFSPAPDNRYKDVVSIDSTNDGSKDASANGAITRGNADLVTKKSGDAFIVELGDAELEIDNP